MATLDIDAYDLEAVTAIFRRHVPEIEVRAFGSRVLGKARRTSDLDLALMTDQPLAWERLADLREAFSESDSPRRVDLLDWASTAEALRRIIDRDSIVLQRPSTTGHEIQ